MADRLILVRHAKAQLREEGLEDFDRTLTPAGLRSCAPAMHDVARRLRRHGHLPKKLALWSSPAARARETAQVLADELGLDAVDVEMRESLWTADIDGFLREVGERKGTVIAVGHNPFLEEVAELLSGVPTHLGKAAAVAVDLDKKGRGKQAWYVPAPAHRDWDTLVQLEQACATAAENLDRNACWFVAEPADPEALHQLRVSTRVARSLAAFVAPWQRSAQADQLKRVLKSLQGPTSSLREWDVLCADLAARETAGKGQTAFLRACEARRDQVRADFSQGFAAPAARGELNDAIYLLRHVQWHTGLTRKGLSAASVGQRYDDQSQAYAADFAACDFTDPVATHDLRKRSKRQRYVARELAGLLGEDRARAGLAAKEDQELLGQLCDARVNRGLVEGLELKGAAAQARDAFAREQARREAELVERLAGAAAEETGE